MIINYPTGLYELPTNGGNITFTISMQSPPRSNYGTTRVPYALVTRPRQTTERVAYNNHVITSYKSSNSLARSARKIYECGQVLDFEDSNIVPIDTITSQAGEYRHDTNFINLSEYGLSGDDVSAIGTEASADFDRRIILLNGYRRRYADIEIELSELHKKSVEINKAIGALVVLGGHIDIITTLNAELSAINESKTSLLSEASELSELSISELENIRKLSELVR